VHPDYVVCLECGFHSQTLRRHLRVQHRLEVAAYRTRWKLSSAHAVTAWPFGASISDGEAIRLRPPAGAGGATQRAEAAGTPAPGDRIVAKPPTSGATQNRPNPP